MARIPDVVEKVPEDHAVLKFSFKYLDLENKKFHRDGCTHEYFKALLAKLHEYSTWRICDFRDEDYDEHRHSIYFPTTSEAGGFQDIPNVDAEQFGYEDGWQFGIYDPEWQWCRWRVHGILIADTFFVVWLDPDHKLYG